MKLVPIEENQDAVKILWDLLYERAPEYSISHKGMPSWQQHQDHVRFWPREAWYLIKGSVAHDWGMAYEIVGAIYLTKADEIGIGIFLAYQGNGFGTRAVEMLMEKHGPRRYLANINPANKASQRMFEKLGFGLTQYTYARAA